MDEFQQTVTVSRRLTTRRPARQLHHIHTQRLVPPTARNHVYIINLPDAVTLGGANDGGAASPAGLQGHVIRCSRR